jgi:hypothetical protein
VVIVNKGSTDEVVKLDPGGIGVGQKFYVYSLVGVDDSDWPQAVVINGYGPTGAAWGPLDSLVNIPAWAYPIENEIRVTSPARSVEFVLLDNGSRIISSLERKDAGRIEQFTLRQNFPNPFNPSTTISYSLPRASSVSLRVYDLVGREVALLINKERQAAGSYAVPFDAASLPSGAYFYTLQTEGYRETKTMLLIK